MIAYKGNTLKWTHENGFQTTDNIIVGKLFRNPDGPWTIAYLIERDVMGYAGVKSYMVDKDTVEKIEVNEVTDDVGKAYWYEEV